MAMFAIRRNYSIVESERRHSTDGYGFFSDVQVEKTTNVPNAVQLRTLFLETPDAQHLVQ
jgi:hypothetical protein